MDVEMQQLAPDSGAPPAHLYAGQRDERESGAHDDPGEGQQLLPPAEPSSFCNGSKPDGSSCVTTGDESICVDVLESSSPTEQGRRDGTLCVKEFLCRALNVTMLRRIKVWMVIAAVIFVVILVIVLSLVLWTELYEDEDEKFDRDSFVVPRAFNGTFRLPNQNFTADLLTSHSEMFAQNLTGYFQEKLTDVYTSSPALGRYFSKALISTFSEGSIIAHFRLEFLMPEEHQDLIHFTLSRPMVSNVLRQYFYDQADNKREPLYVDPASVWMEVVTLPSSPTMQSTEARLPHGCLQLALRRYSSTVQNMEQTVMLPSLLREVRPEDEPEREAVPDEDLYDWYLTLKGIRTTVDSGLFPWDDCRTKGHQQALKNSSELLHQAQPEALFQFHLKGLLAVVGSLTKKSQMVTAKYLDIIGLSS